jgi:hypothetical protein
MRKKDRKIILEWQFHRHQDSRMNSMKTVEYILTLLYIYDIYNI